MGCDPGAALTAAALRAEPPMLTTTAAATPVTPAIPNVPLPTFGGEQFWSDELVYQGWRIQLNALTGFQYRAVLRRQAGMFRPRLTDGDERRS